VPETIVVTREHGPPYSKGLLAQSLSASGLSLERAFALARMVERRLETGAVRRIGVAELSELVEAVLAEEEGEGAVRRFRDWQRVDRLARPLVVMLSGTAGVGKSTLATMLAARLGMTRVIATDAIRQVLRAFFSHEALPVVHHSSFEAGRTLDEQPEDGLDRDVAGFERQAAAVAPGIAAIVERACEERTPLVVEGVHVLPGELDPALRERCLAVEALLVVGDEDRHRAYLSMRGGERPAARYLDRFAEIRKLQRHLADRARDRGVPVIESTTIDGALLDAMDLVLDAVGRVSSSEPG